MKNISVTHTVSSIENLASGPSHSVTSLARAQGELGAFVKLCSLGHSPLGQSNYYKDLRFHSLTSTLPILRQLGVSGPMRRALSSDTSDVIHTHGLWMMPNIYRSANSKFIISPRGMLSSVALSYSSKKKHLFRLLFQERAFKEAILFHATADSEYEDIRRFGLRQPVAVIPNGIDIPKEPEALNVSSRNEVLSLGRIHKKKGLTTLIRSWAEIYEEFPEWRLRIVGPDEGNHARELERLIKNLRIGTISIEPPVFGDDKTKLMSSVDLFVLPSLSENFAMTVAESLSVSVPVISTKGAPWAGLEINGCGWWIDHGSEALTATLRNALALTTEQRRRMGARGRDWMMRDFSWDRIASDMINSYYWVKNAGTPPPQVRIE